MSNEKERLLSRFVIPFELMVTFFALLIPQWIDNNAIFIGKENWMLMFALGPFAFYLFNLFNVSRVLRVTQYAVLIINYFLICVLCSSYIFVVIHVLELELIQKSYVFAFALLSFVFLLGTKFISYKIVRYFRTQGWNKKYLLIYANQSSTYIIDKILQNTYWGYEIRFILSDDEELKKRYPNINFIPPETDLSYLLDNNQIDEVFYCLSDFNQSKIEKIILDCTEVGVVFRVESQLLNFFKNRSFIRFFDTVPFFTVQNTPSNQFHMLFKHSFDRVFSFFLLLGISPLFLIVGVLIKLSSKGPVFFKQERVGLMGRPFTMFKFRTMVVNADAMKDELMEQNEQDGPVFKMKNDPRVTKIGAFLRKTSLDELPQFINVLLGDMSIVGPRPPVQREVDLYERWQRRRLSMKPGITCIWQVSGRNEIEFDEWMEMDLKYIDSWSLKLDLMLFIKTIPAMLKGTGR